MSPKLIWFLKLYLISACLVQDTLKTICELTISALIDVSNLRTSGLNRSHSVLHFGEVKTGTKTSSAGYMLWIFLCVSYLTTRLFSYQREPHYVANLSPVFCMTLNEWQKCSWSVQLILVDLFQWKSPHTNKIWSNHVDVCVLLAVDMLLCTDYFHDSYGGTQGIIKRTASLFVFMHIAQELSKEHIITFMNKPIWM